MLLSGSLGGCSRVTNKCTKVNIIRLVTDDGRYAIDSLSFLFPPVFLGWYTQVVDDVIIISFFTVSSVCLSVLSWTHCAHITHREKQQHTRTHTETHTQPGHTVRFTCLHTTAHTFLSLLAVVVRVCFTRRCHRVHDNANPRLSTPATSARSTRQLMVAFISSLYSPTAFFPRLELCVW